MKQDLQNKIDALISEELADYIAEKTMRKLEAQWHILIEEMVTLRKSHMLLKEDYNRAVNLSESVEALVEAVKVSNTKNAELIEKEDKILSQLIEEFEVK
jgi:hypothetical protein